MAETVYRGIVDARLDSLLPKARSGRFALLQRSGDDGRKMMRRTAAISEARNRELTLCKLLAVPVGEPRSHLRQLIEARDLNDADGCSQLIEPVVEPQIDDVVPRGMAAMAIPGQRGHSVRTETACLRGWFFFAERSEEHTSELQSRENIVCRLLLE